MNERIKELASKARTYYPKTDTSGEFWVFDEEKFAELIINECAEYLMDDGAVEAVAYRLKKHFGVE